MSLLVLRVLVSLLGAWHLGATEEGRWYEIEIAGRACGYHHEVVERVDGLVRTRTDERFAVTRDGVRVEVGQRVVFEEDADGRPIRAEVTAFSGGTAAPERYRFVPGGVEVVVERHGRTSTRTVELAGDDWLTPAESAAFVAARLAAGAGEIRYRTVEPADGMRVVEVRSVRLGEERLEHRGRSLPVSRWRTVTSGSPVELIELRAVDGTVVRAEADLGIGPMRMSLVDRDRALAAAEAPAPELLRSTVVPVSGLSGRSERLVRATYRVRARDSADLELPTEGAQTVRRAPDGSWLVEVDATRSSAATPEELADPGLLAASTLLDIDDPAVRRFTERALRGAPEDRLARAARLRLAVDRHMSRRHFGTAFASASDAVRSRSGDCTEQSVLLAAALRCDGIPARVATGLVHTELRGAAEPVFAWHMWVQALVDGRWFDLDPTRPLDFDAGHLLIATSTLDRQGGEAQLAGILPLLGRLRIECLASEAVVGEGGP